MVISVCIPCYRSAKTLPRVVEAIKEEFKKHPGYAYQIILVNDGSPDNTFEVITQLCREDENIIGMNLSRNHGQVSPLKTLSHNDLKFSLTSFGKLSNNFLYSSKPTLPNAPLICLSVINLLSLVAQAITSSIKHLLFSGI